MYKRPYSVARYLCWEGNNNSKVAVTDTEILLCNPTASNATTDPGPDKTERREGLRFCPASFSMIYCGQFSRRTDHALGDDLRWGTPLLSETHTRNERTPVYL